MKKYFSFFLILFVSLCLIPVGVVSAEEEGAITRLGKWLDGKGKVCECPVCPALEGGAVCPDTPLKDIKRPWFELGFNIDGFEAPAGGRPQFHAENYTVLAIYNLSPIVYLYGSYSTRNVDKINYEGSVYDPIWSYQTFIAGAGWYIKPTIKIFAGLGKVLPKNSEGSEELSFALERGIAWDIPLKQGYKLVISFRSIEAALADDEAHIAASQADGSTNVLSIGLALPLGY